MEGKTAVATNQEYRQLNLHTSDNTSNNDDDRNLGIPSLGRDRGTAAESAEDIPINSKNTM